VKLILEFELKISLTELYSKSFVVRSAQWQSCHQTKNWQNKHGSSKWALPWRNILTTN
jgi:hypothetical protein